MALFGSKERCPACRARKVDRVETYLWICTECDAHGSMFRGLPLYVGIHGNPRRGEAQLNDAVSPSVLAQLAAVAPELRQAASDQSVATAFNYGALNIQYSFEATSFDIEDDDVNAAIASFASNVLGPDVRRDDSRFHFVTFASNWGWWWHYFEREDEVAPEDPAAWLASLTPSGWEASRSERLGNVAQNYAMDDDLPAASIGNVELGEAVIYASFLLFCATMDVDREAPRLGVDPQDLARAHRFGIAVRTAALADELALDA